MTLRPFQIKTCAPGLVLAFVLLVAFFLAPASPPAKAQESLYSPSPYAGSGPLPALQRGVSRRADTMASNWSNNHKTRVRLIAGDTDFAASNSFFVGVQIQLEPGWKTYWRSPGETGVPPVFDWSGSRNLKDTRQLWPAPGTYRDEYSTSIGYAREVVLPVEITAADPGKPVEARLHLSFGICKTICIPIETRLSLTIPTKKAGYQALLARYRQKVPQMVNSTGKVVDGFSIRKITVNLKGKKPGITIDALVPANTKKAALYVEASKGFYLPLASAEQPSSGPNRRFHIDLSKGDPPAELAGQTLALTLVGNDRGIELKHKIN